MIYFAFLFTDYYSGLMTINRKKKLTFLEENSVASSGFLDKYDVGTIKRHIIKGTYVCVNDLKRWGL